MKLICLLLLFLLITIECIQSKSKPIRTYTALRDNLIKLNRLSSYTIYDSSGKKNLYRLRTTSSPEMDTIVLYNYPKKDIIANLEGEWMEKVFDVSFSISDKKLNQWKEERILRKPKTFGFGSEYTTKWFSNNLHTTIGYLSNTMQVFNTEKKELIAEIRTRKPWIGEVKFEIKVYSNQYPDAIYFFIMAIDDHRLQIVDLNNQNGD